MYESCFHCQDKISDIHNSTRKGLFLLMVSQVSVHSWLAPSQNYQGHSGGMLPHLMAIRKQRIGEGPEWKGPGTRYTTVPKVTTPSPPWTHLEVCFTNFSSQSRLIITSSILLNVTAKLTCLHHNLPIKIITRSQFCLTGCNCPENALIPSPKSQQFQSCSEVQI